MTIEEEAPREAGVELALGEQEVRLARHIGTDQVLELLVERPQRVLPVHPTVDDGAVVGEVELFPLGDCQQAPHQGAGL